MKHMNEITALTFTPGAFLRLMQLSSPNNQQRAIRFRHAPPKYAAIF
ncbi:hypothetical protein ACFFJT_16505 [Dyella flava]|uniref:Uncharacterized protein n=1 Tax=Dyella flava TaxID=1920170 RepID=A0ABS2K496_9GAMM|nr:hypothetical protein [Dyella flava]MBM7125870.1 hypothetical protein [Dyella flava]